MAEKAPDSIKQENLGTLRLVMAIYSTTNIDNADIYTTGMDGIVGAWFSPDTTTGVVGISNASGVLTFAASASNQTGTLYILQRG